MSTSIRIIDNRKVAMTNDEWDYYNTICRSYDRPAFKGEELFKGLFESDDDGIIVFIKPPTSRYTSVEVFLFIVGLHQQQHTRKMYQIVNELVQEVKSVIREVKSHN